MSENIRMMSASIENPLGAEQAQYTSQLSSTLADAEQAVLGLANFAGNAPAPSTWQSARKLVEEFKPVPWFIWRLSNHFFSTPGIDHGIPEGMVLGLKRLLLAAASDPLIGNGQKVSDVRSALKVLTPDVVAATSVIHALCRKLASRPLDRMWRPILDEALMRAQIGVHVGASVPAFGKGRGMLAGFSSGLGLAMLIACGEEDQAQKTLEEVATGIDSKTAGIAAYGCNALQVSAMTLSACGCGRDCTSGAVSYAVDRPGCMLPESAQAQWLAAFSITEHVRFKTTQSISGDTWEFLGFEDQEKRQTLIDCAKKIVRRGNAWQWIT